MNVTCKSCAARYAVPDAKVKGRRVRIRCKKCQAPIVIDGTSLPPEAPAEDSDRAKRRAMLKQTMIGVAPPSFVDPTRAPPKEAYSKPRPRQETMVGGLGEMERERLESQAAVRSTVTGSTPKKTPGAAARALERAMAASAKPPKAEPIRKRPAPISDAPPPPPPPAVDEVPASKPAPLPPQPWLVAVSEIDQRSLRVGDIVALYSKGVVTAETFIWREGMDEWKNPFEIDEIARALRAKGHQPPAVDDSPYGFDDGDQTVVGSVDPSGTIEYAQPGRQSVSTVQPPAAPTFDDVTVTMGEREARGLLQQTQAHAAADEDEVTRAVSSPLALGEFSERAPRRSPPPPPARSSFPPPPRLVLASDPGGAPQSRPPRPSRLPPAPSPPLKSPPPSPPAPMASATSGPPPAYQSIPPAAGRPASFPPPSQNPFLSPAPPAFTPAPPAAFTPAAPSVFTPSAPPVFSSPVAVPAPQYSRSLAIDDEVPPFARRGRSRLWLWVLVIALLGGIGAAYALNQPPALWTKVNEALGVRPSAPIPAAEPAPTQAPQASAVSEEPEQSADAGSDVDAAADQQAAEGDDADKPQLTSLSEATKSKAEEDDDAEDDDESRPHAPKFDRAAAAASLVSIAQNAGSCKKPDGPTGRGQVRVTFARNGRVIAADVQGEFAGTSVGRCVASLFRKARVPPYSGERETVAKTFRIE